MTYPPPQAPIPPPPAPAAPGRAQHAAGGRRSGWGRVLAVALAIGLVVAVLTGVGGFVAARGLTGADGTTRCGDGYLCFTAFEPDTLTGFLSEQGYVCSEFSAERCTLVTGSARYEVSLSRGPDGDRVRWYEVTVGYGHGVPLPAKGEEFLAYFAALPLGDDTGAVAEALEWMAAHHQDSRPDRAVTETIGGFDYVLTYLDGLDFTVALRVEAGESWL